MADQYEMTIGGEGVTGEGDFEVLNPATGRPVAVAPDASREQLDAAMSAAQDAFGQWRRDDVVRRSALARAADAIDAAVDDLAPILTQEQGKPIARARGEVAVTANWFRYFAKIDLDPEVIQDDASGYADVVRRPMGVVAAITPWNVPLGLAAWKMAPALRSGNTVVVKPSPYTPLSTLRLVAVLADIFPPGVLNAVSGRDDLGRWMTSHTVPRKVSFTGSTQTGLAVAMASIKDFKRFTLEMGGNDPAIILDDVDVDEIADKLFWSAFANSGQVCCAVKRVYVPEALRSSLVDALADRARTVVVGNGMDPATQLGPLNNDVQRAIVSRLVEEARTSGARIVTGGSALPGDGYFYEPTIVTDVDAGVGLVDREQFGPALPIIGYRDVEEVLASTNAGPFGLSGSVWGTDQDRMARVSSEMDCGTVWMNTHGVVHPHQPFGGVKSSGMGLENGRWGIESFTEAQTRYWAR